MKRLGASRGGWRKGAGPRRAACPLRRRSGGEPRAASSPSRLVPRARLMPAIATASCTPTAFRRLNYKTQVFVYHEGDHYRSRLTHTLEVAQIARALARNLRADEDLTEALALAHDLGHPPFGHAGERALDAALEDAGGFDHNAQSLRVVTLLEKSYARFDGLNLTWETLEGLVKHNGPLTGPHALEGGPVPESIGEYSAQQDLELATFASVEAQAASLADDIAYNNHDIDDGYAPASSPSPSLPKCRSRRARSPMCAKPIPASTARGSSTKPFAASSAR